jgi:dipeptidyl-peptidase-3
LKEFCYDQAEVDRAVKYGSLAGNIHTALHEVVGHASGQIEPGIAGPDITLKSYASTLEEGRADLVALYYMMDPKLVEMGVMPSLEVGKAEYDGYIRNGLMVQLRRLQLGKQVEEAHMRNRQWVSAWVYEKGLPDSVIVKVVRDGHTYFHIRDYEKLRSLFGDLLKEVQRIKSQGDFKAGHDLVENYGVKVDQALHAEVLQRSAHINTAPYAGFIQPRLVPVTDAAGNITDVKIEYPDNFVDQMLEYGAKYSFLPVTP